MPSQISNPVRYALGSALAAALLAGCAGSVDLARAGSGAAAASRTAGPVDKTVAQAEQAVEKAPRDAGTRIALGNAYLQAGRFTSAATAYEDAIALGDRSARTALSVSLAYIGAGRSAEAVTMLNQWRDSIPAVDMGLALALAGETGQGVAVLTDALRAGQDNPTLRQNLAYAYALDGRWREARVMAAQDVPADQLDARLGLWALQGTPEYQQTRVAGLLGAPLRMDAGQPQYLALSTATEAPAMVMAETAPNGLDVAMLGAGAGELAPLKESHGAEPAPARDVFSSALIAEPAHNAPVPGASALFEARPAAVSQPVVQPLPASPAPRAAPAVARSQPASKPAPKSSPKASDGSHAVQLGAFSSRENAERAWTVFVQRNPALRDREASITEAVVRGRKYWRVAAGGFDQRSARDMCARVKGSGGGCIAFAKDRPLPGAVPARGAATSRLAQR